MALIGPTAVGKTALSLALAERIGAEIISADSRQVYKELSIGTDKPSPAALARVPHHFIGEIGLQEPFSAGAFAAQANIRIRSIMRRGCVPLVVGGSTLYLQALMHGLSNIPPAKTSARQALKVRLEQEDSRVLYAELQRIDPASANKLDPSKTQRLVRALEVYHQTGRTLSSYHQQHSPPPFQYEIKVLTMERTRLYERINRRVDHMLKAGLLDEVRGLKAQGYDSRLPALRTIGYQEAFAHLRGEISESEMTRLIRRNTRRYAKRQLTWFRRYDPQHWVDADAQDLPLLSRKHGAGA